MKKEIKSLPEIKKRNIILILFGPPGVGKNYIGKLFQDHFGFKFFDADSLFTNQMKNFLKAGKFPTKEMFNIYNNNGINHVNTLVKTYQKIVASFTLFYEKDRQSVKKKIPGSTMVYIYAPKELVANRIRYRVEISALELALKVFDYFEPIKTSHLKIDNSGEVNLKQEMENILKNLDYI